MRDSALQRAIDAMPTRNGKVAALAEQLGISRAAVSQWPRVPSDRVLEVERITGVPKEELRPDIYPSAQSSAPVSRPSEEATGPTTGAPA